MPARINQPTREEVKEKWIAYAQTRDASIGRFLIEHYYPLVKTSAHRVHVRLGGHVDIDDVISSGVFGLIEAIDAFDPHRGISFETYCAYRIRGAMLDEVRAMDWVPRRIRVMERKLNEAREFLASTLDHMPTTAELAAYLGVAPEKLPVMETELKPARLMSLSTAAQGDADDRVRPGELAAPIEQSTSRAPSHALRQELNENFLRKLSKSERLTITLYYLEGLTLKDVGRVLELSESRISQIHTTAITRLRSLAQNQSVPSPQRFAAAA